MTATRWNDSDTVSSCHRCGHDLDTIDVIVMVLPWQEAAAVDVVVGLAPAKVVRC